MRPLFSRTISWWGSRYRICFLGFIVLAGSLSLFADTPALLRTVPAGGCYCHCAESHARGGCVKLFLSKLSSPPLRAKKSAEPHTPTPATQPTPAPTHPPPRPPAHP